MNGKEELRKEILRQIDVSREIDDREIQEIILRTIKEYGRRARVDTQEYLTLAHEFYNSFRRLDTLQDLVDDPEITEIMINGASDIFIEKDGRLFPSDRTFSSSEKLQDIIQQIVGSTNRIVNESSPIVDTRLPNGSRINVVLPPVAVNGPVMTIRKFPKNRMTMEDLVRMNSITEEAAAFLGILVKAGYNILISGGTGSGKSTFLNILTDFIPADERLIVIEDNMELQITEIPNIVRLEAHNANTEGEGVITIRDLIRTALRMRPDRIIVGEVRGGEAIDMLQAMNTGHDGSLSTGHANSPGDMLSRLETMVLMGMELPLPAIRRQMASGIDVIVHLERFRDKSRRVARIVEVGGLRDGEIELYPLFVFREEQSRDPSGIVQGELEKHEDLKNRQKLENAGLSLS